MRTRRDFLKRSLQLGAGGLYTGFVAGCATPETPGVVDASRTAAPQAGAPPEPPQVARPGDLHGGPVPPPDLFDASLLDADFWLKPRTVSLYRPATDEHLSLLYWKDGELVPGSYERLCTILRDVQAKETVRMDPKLIETLWACQAFCARYGINHPIHVLSGYRTAATNRHLIETGLPAARKSLHLDGKAADIRIIDLNTEVLGGLVRSFERGGVGFYFRPGTTGGWIHTDTGINRIWHG